MKILSPNPSNLQISYYIRSYYSSSIFKWILSFVVRDISSLVRMLILTFFYTKSYCGSFTTTDTDPTPKK